MQLSVDAQYYDGITPTASCGALKTELSTLISSNVIYLDYADIDDTMCVRLDLDINGNIIDRYTTITSYDCSDSGSSSNSEGGGWNREHVFASSWFGAIPATRSDLHNLFPSDIHVNSLKANLPLGEVTMNNVNGLSLSKIGPDANDCSDNCNNEASGYVFEPADQYKGDFARAMLYMAVAYEDQAAAWENISSCGDDVMTGDPFKFYTTCYLNLMIKWHTMDPPDQLELDRNDAIFIIQGNRNPFIDHPEYATDIWGNNCCPSCEPFTVEAIPVCSSIGNTFDISYTINSTSSISGPFTILESVTNTSFTGLTATGTIAGLPYTSTSQNNKVTLTIIDEATGCSINYDVLQLNCSEKTVCDCTQADPFSINVQASGNGNGFSMVYTLVDPSTSQISQVNQTGSFGPFPDNIVWDVYAFNVSDSELTAFVSALQQSADIAEATDDIPSSAFETFCYTFLTTSLAASCNCPTMCEDIVVDATTECAVNGTYSIVINSITGGDDILGNYNVSIAGTNYTFPNDFPLTGQVYSGGNQAGVILFITDADSPTCVGQFTVFELNCLPQEVCDCTTDPMNSLTINAQATGNANGFLMLYVLVDTATGNVIAYNSTGSFSGLLGNNTGYTVYAVNYDIDDDFIINEIDDLIGSSVTPLVTNVTPFDSYCYTSMMAAFSEDCGCLIPFCEINPEDPINIICDDNGTPEDPSDDEYSFDVIVNGQNTNQGASMTALDDQGNTIAYGSTQSYGPFDIINGDITILYTDAEDPTCFMEVTAPAPAPCSFSCSIDLTESMAECNDNGTPDDPTDDTFMFDINVDGMNTNLGASNMAIDNQGNTIPYGSDQQYSFPISGGNVTITYTDINDPLCTTSVEILAPITCSISCNLIVGTAENILCDDKGTPNDSSDDSFTFSVTVTGSNTDPLASNTFDDDQGNSGVVYGTTLSYGPFNIINGAVEINYIDADGGIDCDGMIMVDPPASCSVLTCSDIVVDATTECAADGTYTIIINSISGGDDVGVNYIVNIAGTDYDLSDFPLTGQVYSGGNQAGVILFITDADSPTCVGQFTVFELNCLPQEVCDCTTDPVNSLTINAQATGNANGFLMLYMLVDSATDNVIAYNSTGSFPGLLGNNTGYTVYAVNYDIDDDFIINDIDDLIGSAVTPLVTNAAPFDSYCYTSMMAVFSEDCGCVLPMCSITPEDANTIVCDDNGSPDDPTDDTFTFDVVVNGSNTFTGAANTFFDDQGNAGIAYGTTVNYGPFPISGGSITVNFTDTDDGTCVNMVTATEPAVCSAAGCSDIVVEATTICDPSGAETFSIDIQSITGGDGVGTDYNVTIDGTVFSYPADFPLTGLTYSGTGVQPKITMLIEDADDTSCTLSYDVFELNCTAQETCDCDDNPFSYEIQVQAAADANGFDLVYILTDGTNVVVNLDGNFPGLMGASNAYTVYAVHVESVDLATILSVSTQADLDELIARTGSFATSCYNLSSQDYIGDCGCSTDCSINNLMVSTTCDGSFEGTYDVEICFNVSNPASTEFTVSIAGQDVGPFAYSSLDAGGCIILTVDDIALVGDSETNIPVSIFDGSSGNEIEPFISEFHYDDDSTDDNEGVEITGMDGFDLTGYQLIAYNGSGGAPYRTVNLTGTISGSPCGSLFFDINGAQNGPDGFALVDPDGNVLEFISYEGVFVATSGPATGITSTDVGVVETSGLDTESLQLTDAGWVGPITATPNVINDNLTCGIEASTCMAETVYDELPCFDPCSASVIAPILPDITESCTIEDLFVSIEPGEVLEPVPASTLFFSEYIEGSSNNKCFEIFNGTGAPVDLTDWSVSVYTNGNSSPSNSVLPPGVILADGDVFVVCNTSADAAALAVTDANIGGVTGFNGNDDLALVNPDGEIVDFIGTVATLLNFGTDVTLVRDCSIVEGRTDSTGLFIATDEWLVFPTDDFSNLGAHDYCGLGFVPEDCTFNVYLQDPASGGVAVLTDVEEGFDVEDIPIDITDDQVFFITCVNEFGCESPASSTQIFIQDLGTIACEDLVQVSLGFPCDYQVPGSLLLSDGRNISFYDLTLIEEYGDTLPSDIVTQFDAGQTLDYKLTDLCSGVSCWGKIKVELKRKPVVTSPCSFIPGSEQLVLGSFADDIDDELSFEVIDDCQTVEINVSADPKYSCGTQSNPDWCNGTFSVTVLFHDGIVYSETGIVDQTTISLNNLQLGDFVVLIESDAPSTEGNYTSEIIVSNCDPAIDCILTCAVNDPIDSIFFGSLTKPSNGFLTISDVLLIVNESCFQPVFDMRQTIVESGDKCDGGIRREVTYTGSIQDGHGGFEKIEVIKQVYKEVQTPFDTIQVPHNLDLPCDAPNHPDSIFNRFFIEDNSIADSIAISNAYPYVFLKGMLGGQIIRSVRVEVPVIDHYLVNIDTVKVERLINDEWLLVELINKELRDSIRYVEVTKWAYVLIPFTPQNPKCDYVLNFDDVIVPKCGNEVLTLRTWTFIDWCTQEIKTLPAQRIRNIDSGPELVDSLIDQTISIDPFVCTASFELPAITGTDACGTDEGLTVEWKTDEGRIADGYVLDLWESNSPVTLVATISDECGNSAKDTMLLTINDFVAPTAICYSELEVGITDGGLVIFDADDFDNGSHDFGCGDVWVKAIRVESLRGTTNGYWNRNGVDRQPDYSLGPDPSFTFRYSCSNEDADDFTALYRDQETELRILGVDIGRQVFYDDQLGICCADVDSEEIFVRVRVFDVNPGPGPVDPRRMEVEPTGPIYVRDRLDKNRLAPTNKSVPNDLFGHFTDCIVKLNFTNKLEPQLTCENYNIDCLTDLSSIPAPVARGGVCGTPSAELISQSEFVNTCGNGDIIQEWYIDTDDQAGFSEGDEHCIQIIAVNEGPGQFDPFTIKWPKHMDGSVMQGINLECAKDSVFMDEIEVQMGDAMNCIPSFDSESDQAVWCTPTCALVGYTVDIDTIEASDVCLKIIRNHTIIDWCLWEPNGSNPEVDSDRFIAVEDWAQGDCILCENGVTSITGGAEQVYLRYTEVDTDGYYNYSQVLKVLDTTRPDVLVQDTFYVEIRGQGDKDGTQEDCQASGLITAVAEDFCGLETTTEVLLAWNVTVYDETETVLFSEFQLTDTFSFLSPEGMDDNVYRVEWEVRDGCGNSSTATSLIVFNDVAAPVPLCVQGTTTAFLQPENEVKIYAKDFDLGSYDACSDILFTIVGRGAEPLKPGQIAFEDQHSITLECQVFVDVAQLDVWVWDSSGNGRKCPVNVVINESCEDEDEIPEGSALITGFIQTETGIGIETAEVSIHTTAPEYPVTTNTSSGGAYSFINNPFGLDYELDVYKTGDYLNGVSTADLLAIQKHILNQESLDSPYKLIAADVNNDQKVSALDIINLRNVILGLSRRFSNNTSWRFIDAAFEFEDPQNPWPFTEKIYIDRLREAMLDQNYVGVKIGDVNGNVQANSILQSNPRRLHEVELSTIDQDFAESEIIRVPIYSAEQQLNGFQFTLEHPQLSLLDIEKGSINITEANLGRHTDMTTFSYYGSDTQVTNDALFTLVFETRFEGALSTILTLSSAITIAEAYEVKSNVVNGLALHIISEDMPGIELHQNTPNPFSESTYIEFYLPASMSAQLIIYTVQGQQLLTIDQVFEKGTHQIKIASDLFSTSGIYYYELKTPDLNLYKKMLFVE